MWKRYYDRLASVQRPERPAFMRPPVVCLHFHFHFLGSGQTVRPACPSTTLLGLADVGGGGWIGFFAGCLLFAFLATGRFMLLQPLAADARARAAERSREPELLRFECEQPSRIAIVLKFSPLTDQTIEL